MEKNIISNSNGFAFIDLGAVALAANLVNDSKKAPTEVSAKKLAILFLHLANQINHFFD